MFEMVVAVNRLTLKDVGVSPGGSAVHSHLRYSHFIWSGKHARRGRRSVWVSVCWGCQTDALCLCDEGKQLQQVPADLSRAVSNRRCCAAAS